jgi:sensor histidine kinase YesM
MPARLDRWRRTGERLLDGLTWKGLALITLLCLLNSVRRQVMTLPEDLTLFDRLVTTASLTGLGLLVAIPIALAVVVTYNRVSGRRSWRYPALAFAVLVSSAAGTALALAVEWLTAPADFASFSSLSKVIRTFVQGHWIRYATLGALFTAVYVYGRVAEERTASARQAELDRKRLDQQMEEARLHALQAQIEPHFLFNTLATVRRLYHTSSDSAVAMLDNLMRYLSVALPQMRSDGTTLGREAALAEAYLDIQKLRMGRRLGFTIALPAELRDAPIPPMMLLTLVENAIKHGLDPLPEGGFIRIDACADGDRLRLQVSDSGLGFIRTSGAGTGLANIRARLAALYGRAARLDLGENLPRGITAALTLPLSVPDSAAAAR